MSKHIENYLIMRQKMENDERYIMTQNGEFRRRLD